MVFILNFSYTPEVFATLDKATIRGLDIFSRTNDREGDSVSEHARMLSRSLVIGFNGGLVNANSLGGDDFPDALFEEE